MTPGCTFKFVCHSAIQCFSFCVLIFFSFFSISFAFSPLPDSISLENSWFSGSPRENATPAAEESPTHLASASAASSSLVTAEDTKSSHWRSTTTSNPSPQVTSTSSTSVHVETESMTQAGNRKDHTVTQRAGGRGGRGRGKKNRGEDRSRWEEKSRGEEDGSGEIVGAEAKGEIQVSRRPVGTSKPRERSRSRERGHRRGQTTTTAPTTTTVTATAAPMELSTGSLDATTSESSSAAGTASPSGLPSSSSPPFVAASTSPSQPLVQTPSPESQFKFQPTSLGSPSPSSALSFLPAETPFSLSSSLSPSSPTSDALSQTAGSGDPALLAQADSSKKPVTSLHWVPLDAAGPSGSQDFPPLLSGAPEEEEAVWSHAVGSGALLPGNIEDESSRAGANTSTVTLTTTGELQFASVILPSLRQCFLQTSRE